MPCHWDSSLAAKAARRRRILETARAENAKAERIEDNDANAVAAISNDALIREAHRRNLTIDTGRAA